MSTSLKNIVVAPFAMFLLIAWFFIFIPLTVLTTSMIVLASFISANLTRKIGILWGRLGLYLTFSRVKMYDEHHFSVPDPVIIITNHRSFVDILVALGFFQKDFLFLSKKENFSIPFIGRAMKQIGFIPVDRSSPRKAAQSIIRMVEEVTSGKNILIYPEGTRNYKTDNMLPLKAGVMTVAMKSKVTILPIVVYDTKKIYSPARNFRLFPTKLKAKVLEPITMSSEMHPGNQTSNMNKTQQLESIRQIMQDTFDDLSSQK